jgi:MFS family permease
MPDPARPSGLSAATRSATSERPYQTLRHRDFRLLWSAELVSTTGTQIQRVAIAWQVFDLTGDPLQLGLLGLARFFPVAAFGLFGGVMADRRDRRLLMLLSQLGLCGIALCLAVLSGFDLANVAAIYGLTFASAACAAIGGPSRQALIPTLVPERSIAGAFAMGTLSMQVASVSGPPIGGLIIAQFGVTVAYAIDAVTFLAVIAALLAMLTRSAVIATQAGGLTLALEGLRFLRGTPILLGVMALDFVATFFGATTTLMPIFAAEVHHVGPRGLGLLLAAPAAGAVTASLVIGTRRMPERPGLGVILAVAVFGSALVGFGLSTSFPLSLACLALSGGADAVSMAYRLTIRTLVTPDALRGRIAAVHSTFAMGGPQLGEFEAGLLASMVGVGPGVAIGGLLTVAAAGVTARRVPAIAHFRL